MSDRLLKETCSDYESDMELMRLHEAAIRRVCMVERIRFLVWGNTRAEFRWHNLRTQDLADIIACGILDDFTGLSWEMFKDVRDWTMVTPDDCTYCIAFKCRGERMIGNIHIALLDDMVFVTYYIVYDGQECIALWTTSLDSVLED